MLAADGARSTSRRLLGLDFKGQVFKDRFLIADVIMKADFPTERWFWFDPPFNKGQSALLHKQPDDVWRIDLQLGWDADPEEERKPENVIPRLKAMLGDEVEFELEWVSVYTFQCRRLEEFTARAASSSLAIPPTRSRPSGARGANSGLQDIDNLAWKLDLVLAGKAPESLLKSYHAERAYAADENILNSTRSTDFITPKSDASRAFRDAVLDLARDHDFARRLVNSGRLSLPSTYSGLRPELAGQPGFPGRHGAGCPLRRRAGHRRWPGQLAAAPAGRRLLRPLFRPRRRDRRNPRPPAREPRGAGGPGPPGPHLPARPRGPGGCARGQRPPDRRPATTPAPEPFTSSAPTSTSPPAGAKPTRKRSGGHCSGPWGKALAGAETVTEGTAA